MKKLLFIISLGFCINGYSSGYINMKGLYSEINSNYAIGAGLDAGFRISSNLALEGYFDYFNFETNDTMHFGFKVAYFFMKMLSLKAGAGIFNQVNSNSSSNFELILAPGLLLPITRTSFFTLEGVYRNITDDNGGFIDHSYGGSAGLMFIL